MNFLLPIGLLGLLALPIVLLLHLIRQRRRRVAVPSLLLWANIPRREEGERARRLPLTLLLLLHLLVAAALGLALARPQLAGVPSNQPEQTAIVLDTSTSMAARSGGSSRFELAQAQARVLLNSMMAGGRATLISAGPTAQIVADGSAGDIPTLLAALAALRPGGVGADLAGALTLAEASLDLQRSARIVVLTDDAGAPIADQAVAAPVEWRRVGENQPNRAVVAFAARPFGNNLHVYARLANYSTSTYAGSVQLFADEQLVDTRTLAFNSDGETELTWKIPVGARALRLTLAGNDALALDDQALLNVATSRPLNVLLVSAQPETLQRALRAVAGVTTTVVSPDSYAPTQAAQQAADLTIFDSMLPEAWPPGGVLVINPPPGRELLQAERTPLQVNGENLAARGALLEGLSLGGVRFGVTQPLTLPAWGETLLSDGDTPLIVRGRTGSSELAVWAFDLAGSNLPNRLAFPLLVARTVRDLTPGGLPAALQAGATLTLRPGLRATELRLTAPDNQVSTVASAPVVSFAALTQPGWYRLAERGADGDLFSGQVAVNAGSPAESDLRPQPAPRLTTAAPVAAGSGQSAGSDLWPWLAAVALVLLAAEWLYLHGRRAPAQ